MCHAMPASGVHVVRLQKHNATRRHIKLFKLRFLVVFHNNSNKNLFIIVNLKDQSSREMFILNFVNFKSEKRRKPYMHGDLNFELI